MIVIILSSTYHEHQSQVQEVQYSKAEKASIDTDPEVDHEVEVGGSKMTVLIKPKSFNETDQGAIVKSIEVRESAALFNADPNWKRLPVGQKNADGAYKFTLDSVRYAYLDQDFASDEEIPFFRIVSQSVDGKHSKTTTLTSASASLDSVSDVKGPGNEDFRTILKAQAKLNNRVDSDTVIEKLTEHPTVCFPISLRLKRYDLSPIYEKNIYEDEHSQLIMRIRPYFYTEYKGINFPVAFTYTQFVYSRTNTENRINTEELDKTLATVDQSVRELKQKFPPDKPHTLYTTLQRRNLTAHGYRGENILPSNPMYAFESVLE